MVFVILVPIFLLPIFLILLYFYQKVFEGNSLLLGLLVIIVVLSGLVYGFYKLHWDEKLSMRTSKYAFRFNDTRQQNGLPLLTDDYVQDGKTWNTKLDSVTDKTKFVLLQKTIEENDDHTDAEQEFNFFARALNDTQVVYLKTQYNFVSKNYYAETTTGKLSRPSYRINKVQLFDDCCSKAWKRAQVDSMLAK